MPRTITNLYGLPTSIYNALAHDAYVGGGDISITRLISPPRIVSLRKHHEDEIVEDASERVWSLLGSSVHSMMERSAGEGVRVEQRLEMPINGLLHPETREPWIWRVSGQPDIYEEDTLSDYKVTSVFSFLLGDKPEWTNQLNLQAMLHRHHGDLVTRIRIIAILRDWSQHKARVERDYPQCAVHVVELPLWTQKIAIDYAEHRVRLHQSAWREYVKSKFDEAKLPMCTESERWYRGSKWPVIKNGNKRADRVFDSLKAAEEYRDKQAPHLKPGRKFQPIVERPGEYIRCQNYCDVSGFCSFGRMIKEQERQKAEAATTTEYAEDQVPVEAE